MLEIDENMVEQKMAGNFVLTFWDEFGCLSLCVFFVLPRFSKFPYLATLLS